MIATRSEGIVSFNARKAMMVIETETNTGDAATSATPTHGVDMG